MNIDAGYSHIRQSMRFGALYKGKEAQTGEAVPPEAAAENAAAGGDTVTISDLARRLHETDKPESVVGQALESGLGKGNLRAEGLSGEAKSPADTGDAYLETIKKQIEAAEEQLQEATRNLQEAEIQNDQPSPETVTAEEGGTGSGESEDVKSARLEVSEANTRIAQLKQEMAKALKERLGLKAGGGGCISGTRCGSVGAPAPSKIHIGEAQDPYAAAQAYAAENGG